jgi:radical SAM protein with 4Fe4S-binding SPASM domain
VLAMAMLSVPVLAQGIAGNGGVDILGQNGGIFETEGSAFNFPEMQDTNIATLIVGNDKALAFGNIWQKTSPPTATNNLEIKKNQDSGACEQCAVEGSCMDPCIKVNIDQITVGNREAMAFGFAIATNNVKIVANQQ